MFFFHIDPQHLDTIIRYLSIILLGCLTHNTFLNKYIGILH